MVTERLTCEMCLRIGTQHLRGCVFGCDNRRHFFNSGAFAGLWPSASNSIVRTQVASFRIVNCTHKAICPRKESSPPHWTSNREDCPATWVLRVRKCAKHCGKISPLPDGRGSLWLPFILMTCLSFLLFCGTTKPNTKRQNAESDRFRRFLFTGHFFQYFRHFPASAPTRRQVSVRRKNNRAPERGPQVSPDTPKIKVSNSQALR